MVGKIIFRYTYFNKRKKYIHATWRIGSIVLTKHVPSFISFLLVNVFHPYTAPLITRCVLQERSKIFLSRRVLLDGFDQDEGNCGRLTWTQPARTLWSRCRYTSMTLNVKLRRTLSPLWTSWGTLTSRPQSPLLKAQQKGPRWKNRSDLRSRAATYQYYRWWHIWNKPACLSCTSIDLYCI